MIPRRTKNESFSKWQMIEGLRCAEFVSKKDANKFAKELGDRVLKNVVLEKDGEYDVWCVYYTDKKDVRL